MLKGCASCVRHIWPHVSALMQGPLDLSCILFSSEVCVSTADAAPLSATTSARSNTTSVGPLSHRQSARLPPQHPSRTTPRPLSSHTGLIASPTCSYAWLVNDNPVATMNVPPARPEIAAVTSPTAILEERAKTAPVASSTAADDGLERPSISVSQSSTPPGKDGAATNGTPRNGIWSRIKGRRESEEGSGKLRTWLRGGDRGRVKSRGVVPREEPEEGIATVPPAGGQMFAAASSDGRPQTAPLAKTGDRTDVGRLSGLRTSELCKASSLWSDSVPEEEEEDVEEMGQEGRSSSSGRRASVAALSARPSTTSAVSRRATLATAPASRTVSPPKARRAAAATPARGPTVAERRRGATAGPQQDRSVERSRSGDTSGTRRATLSVASKPRAVSPPKTGALRDRRTSLAPSIGGARSVSYGTGSSRRAAVSGAASQHDPVKHASLGTGGPRRASIAPVAAAPNPALRSTVGCRGSLAPAALPGRPEEGGGGSRRMSLAVHSTGSGAGRRASVAAGPRQGAAAGPPAASRRMSVAAAPVLPTATRGRPSIAGGIGRRATLAHRSASAAAAEDDVAAIEAERDEQEREWEAQHLGMDADSGVRLQPMHQWHSLTTRPIR